MILTAVTIQLLICSMNRMMNKLSKIALVVFYFLALTANNTVHAQNIDSTKSRIEIIGKYIGNKVVLRWAPSDNISFKMLLKYGYKLEKAQIGQDTTFNKAQFQTIGTFFPADSMTWKKRINVKNTYQVVAAQAALGEFRNEIGENPNLKELKDRYTEEKNMHGFALLAADMDTVAANLLGLRFEDLKVKSNATYVYKITSLCPKDNLEIMGNTCYVLTKKEELSAPPNLEYYGYENHIKIGWPTLMHQSIFSGYFLEKGNSKGKNFKRYNKMPYVFTKGTEEKESDNMITLTDEVETDYEVFSYRLIGVTAFGEESAPSKVIFAYGRDRTPPEKAFNVTASDINGTYLNIQWDKENIEKDFVGFNVLRSSNSNGPFEVINLKPLSAETKSFIDKSPDALMGSFYKIETIDTAGNIDWSLGVYGFLKDSIPPSIPLGLKGDVDSNGVVTLTWNLGPELDIKGYRVYYANQDDHEFTNITPYLYQDTVFIDTVNINTLTKNIYYQIAVSDHNYNHSAKTNILKVKLPDTIPPVKPLFKDILVTDSAVYLNWIPSTSKDVKSHEIFRKVGNGDFHLWKTIEGKTSKVEDQEVVVKGVYTYLIRAIDEDNNKSPFSNEISAEVYDIGKRKPIQNFNVTYNKETKRVILNWVYPNSDAYHYAIYRSYNESTFRIYKSTDANKNSYEDYNLPGKGTYTYAIVALYKDGGTSGLSEKKKILLE